MSFSTAFLSSTRIKADTATATPVPVSGITAIPSWIDAILRLTVEVAVRTYLIETHFRESGTEITKYNGVQQSQFPDKSDESRDSRIWRRLEKDRLEKRSFGIPDEEISILNSSYISMHY